MFPTFEQLYRSIKLRHLYKMGLGNKAARLVDTINIITCRGGSEWFDAIKKESDLNIIRK